MHATLVLGAPLQRAHPRLPAKASAGSRCRAGPPAVARCRRQSGPPTRAFFNLGGGGGATPQPAAGDSNGPPAAAASSNSAQGTMVSDGAIKSLSPEARRIFREAQDNIIELNKSRLRALEELKAARQKIAELEGKLENAVAEATSATAQLQQLGPASSQQAAQALASASGQAATGEVLTFNFGQQQQAAAAAAAAAAAQQQQQQAVQQQQQQPPMAQQPAEAGPSVTVVYETGWNSAFLHYNADGRGWTTVPGAKMENGNQQFPDKKVITVPARRLEFVINDGGNDWDKPFGKQNYVVESPGTYRIKNGKVGKLA